MNLGSELRRHRKSRNYTLVQLAEKVGVSPSYLSEIEQNKKRPSIKTVMRIAEALGIDANALLPPELSQNGPEEEIYLGGKLKVARVRKGWNLTKTSKLAGISPAYLSQIERGQVNPSIDVLKRLADVLGISLPVVMNRTNPRELGERLKTVRTSLGMSRKELAGKAGVSASLVAQIEQGKSGASLETLERLATALGVTPCSLILETDQVTEDLLTNLKPECKKLLAEPRVQALLQMVCDLDEKEFRFILNFIKLFRENWLQND
ncbi:MAG: helix-turn-helix domain-containing protein [Firmicutes bacterium]|nr:helix-turn-helix domain-containing protein [Bacillota bacterium]